VPRMGRYELRGKVALVTGAARGIGFETSKALVARGARVVVVDLDAGQAEAAAALLSDNDAIGIGADVTDRSAMQRAVAVAVERFGGLDVVVANAGITARAATMRATSPEVFERIIDVNLLGVYRTVDAALPQIVERRGHVVVIASVYAFANGLGQMPYAMAKAGVEQLGRALRVELLPHGASASVAYFGFIDTSMVHQSLDQDPGAERMLATVPKFLHKRLHPKVAGGAIVRGIELRRPRIIQPRRWIALSWLRGILNPITDAAMERDERVRAIVDELDGRGGQEQRTTA
jgi:NAD(P)-dependent dehydrogenase (short-subunit alcohol dehydrogenase family)